MLKLLFGLLFMLLTAVAFRKKELYPLNVLFIDPQHIHCVEVKSPRNPIVGFWKVNFLKKLMVVSESVHNVVFLVSIQCYLK